MAPKGIPGTVLVRDMHPGGERAKAYKCVAMDDLEDKQTGGLLPFDKLAKTIVHYMQRTDVLTHAKDQKLKYLFGDCWYVVF